MKTNIGNRLRAVTYVPFICLVGLLAANGQISTNRWQGVGNTGVGDFDESTNWDIGQVPGSDSLTVFNNHSGLKQNWQVTLGSDVTNKDVSMIAPLLDYETLFVMNQHVWTVKDNMLIWEASGGRVTFTNGTIRARQCAFKPGSGSPVTNLVLTMADVVCEARDMYVAAATATHDGGRLRVTNSLTVGDWEIKKNTSKLKLAGNVQCNVDTWLRIDGEPNSSAMLDVSGGSNTFGKAQSDALTLIVAKTGKGTLLGSGGTNSVGCHLSIGSDVNSVGEMTVTNGNWTIRRYIYVGYGGTGTLTISGGEIFVAGAVMPLARYATGRGTLTVSGGLLDLNGGELWVGRPTGSVARFVLTGDGVVKAKSVFERESGAASEVLFDGGTLQAARNDAQLIGALDDVRLTAKGLVVDTDGHAVSTVPELKNAVGEAGAITKKGAGTLTVSGTRSATGPVSVLEGILTFNEAVTVQAGVSRIDGTLALPDTTRLTVASGAALAGTGSVARVTLADGAAFARAKADGATTPLEVNDCMASSALTVALSGYTQTDLLASLPLLQVPTASFTKPGSVSVTLDGTPNAGIKAKYTEVGGNTVLAVRYMTGTLISVW
mgnify:CR=1 FL=1